MKRNQILILPISSPKTQLPNLENIIDLTKEDFVVQKKRKRVVGDNFSEQEEQNLIHIAEIVLKKMKFDNSCGNFLEQKEEDKEPPTSCVNCGVKQTSCWRSITDNKGNRFDLCNKCGLKYRKGNFCQCCLYIYYVSETKNDSSDDTWVKCLYCPRKSHKVCLEKQSENNVLYICNNCKLKYHNKQ